MIHALRHSIVVATCVLSIQASAQPLNLQWSVGLSATTNMFSIAMVTDPNGAVFICGSLSGVADMDPGPGTVLLGTDGESERFVAKYDASGAHVFSFTTDADISDLVLNAAGEVLLVGSFSGTVDLDPGAGETLVTSAGTFDAYVARYGPDGDFLSGFSFGGASVDVASRIAVDADGDLHVLGEFNDATDLDPGPGSFILETGNADDLFLAHYTAAGVFVNGFALETRSADDLALTSTGDVLITCDLLDPLDIDPGPGTTLLTSVGGVDGFWARYTADYVFEEGYSYDGGVNDIAVDDQDNVYIMGRLPTAMDVDLGPGVVTLNSENNFDIYYVKYAPDGTHLQSEAFVSDAIYTQNEMVVDGQERMYFCGRFIDAVDFAPATPEGDLVSQGSNDAFIVRIGPSGILDLAAGIGDVGSDRMMDLSVRTPGYVYTFGDHVGTADMDLGPDVSTVNSGSVTGIFFARYSTPDITSVNERPTAVQWDMVGENDRIRLDLTAYTGPVEVQVSDVSGRVIAQRALPRGQVLLLDTPTSAGQVYLVTVSAGGSRITQRLFVQ